MYVRASIGTLSRESRVVVVRAINCVIAVANTMCHVVKNRAKGAIVSVHAVVSLSPN